MSLNILYPLLAVAGGIAFGQIFTRASAPDKTPPVTQGSLYMLNAKGNPTGVCPLQHTDVHADISGPLARVTVTQKFINPSHEKIEAVYTFPLPHDAAIDDMQMRIGDRVIQGMIKGREEARSIYDTARAAGHVASLLDQERPNIFMQSVANIVPGAEVDITIRYVQTVAYEEGEYQFVFPMVVAPRYTPGSENDGSSLNPPVTPPGTRAGHDISVSVSLDPGVPLGEIDSPTHALNIAKNGENRATVGLQDQAVIPNKDFILRYGNSGQAIHDTVLAHHDQRGGYFTLMLQPPSRPTAQQITPRELVFVLDTSGSMMGFPIEKAKEVIHTALDNMNPNDTFNLITFSGDEHILFPEPVPATRENVRKAQEFLASRRGSGGTEMMKAIRAALDPSDSEDHIRVVCFMTDGEVGDDMEILGEVQKHPNARVFAFGIGSSVNRFLLDGMARYGRGDVEYVGLNDDGSAAAKRFYQRIHNPVLTDISIDWNGLPVSEVYPQRIPDLFAAKPVVISGRYTGAAHGVIRLRGKVAGKPFSRDIQVNLPGNEPAHEVLATLWARRKVADLVSQDFAGVQNNNASDALRNQIAQLGLDYKLLTPYTSFVAVEETTVTEGGQPKRVQVPVNMPQGMSYEGVFGSPGGSIQAMYGPGSGGGFAKSFAIADSLEAPPPLMRSIPRAQNTPPARTAPTPIPNANPNGPSKLDPLLLNLQPGATAHIEIWLTNILPQTIEKLKKLGVVIVSQPKGTTLVIAKVPAEKLLDVAMLPEVRYLTPVK